MSSYLGIDTSNYTTSAAIYNLNSGEIINKKKLLPVEDGACGLMQSKALFEHIRQLPEIIEAAFSCYSKGKIDAVGVSVRPRDVEGSYMPVFLSGRAVARGIASSKRVPCYEFSHQAGHILAALYSADKLSLKDEKFIAFHVSGGTTEALLVTPDKENIVKCEIIAKSLDLKAGQAIDRIGTMLKIPFPCGAQLDRLALSGCCKPVKPTMKGADCCLSGIENKAQNMVTSGAKKEDIARYAVEAVCAAIDKMTEIVLDKFGPLPILYAGGVMSNSIISKRMNEKYGGLFAKPELSSDNAVGIAIAAAIKDNQL
jgi:N6-L-threonylcarbamoyladenine synthase